MKLKVMFAWLVAMFIAGLATVDLQGQWLLDDGSGNVSVDSSSKGYATGHLGKWHLGGRVTKPKLPEYGFDMAMISDNAGTLQSTGIS